ncbi:FAD-binding protein [Natronolimnobius sp. AArcel1]|uniref:FAD-binding protein n=1 Tax=Natronolimnobius sp. AArcel1 TaxID=1679093 RepID=UPI0013E9B51D|nr:FAD-binding protein [Natronolimnobius sp. AArcel1]NGM71310.1 FAD-binding protein [Natronolimnobius sp. AArcel1]
MRDGKSYNTVVGCGIAGLCAGLRAAERDLSVAVLEKAPKENRGGYTQFTESFRIPTTDIDLDVEFNIEDYAALDFYRDIMNVTNYLGYRSH